MRPQRFRSELYKVASPPENALGLLLLFILLAASGLAGAQGPAQSSVEQKIRDLSSSMQHAQAQLEASQRELESMRQQLAALQQQLAKDGSSSAGTPPSQEAASATNPAPANEAALDELRERQAMQETQIAVHEQKKVESESKYPVTISGLLLMSGFANSRGVDMPATPTLATGGAGNTGASVRQTILGIDARGPHLLGASSHGDLRVDFDGMSGAGSGSLDPYSVPYSANAMLLRLRTAHATLDWTHTQAFWELDKPILSPDAPSSLIAIAEPEFAWSGNLWVWTPQAGITQDVSLGSAHYLRLQAAMIDAADAPLSYTAYQSSAGTGPSSAELSRWPGVEARVALLGTKLDQGMHIGVGGYFSPHRTTDGDSFDAWAATLDYRLSLPAHLQLTGGAYRGLALGGLGGGAYKDYLSRVSRTGGTYYRPFDDIGGWTQLTEQVGARLQLNEGFGIDEVFASQLRPYADSASPYENLARNRTYVGSAIYAPSAYLLFSLEYRRLDSLSALGTNAGANIVGVAAGYKF